MDKMPGCGPGDLEVRLLLGAPGRVPEQFTFIRKQTLLIGQLSILQMAGWQSGTIAMVSKTIELKSSHRFESCSRRHAKRGDCRAQRDAT